jgi:hypothetical protein
MATTAKEILSAARTLIKEMWCKGVYVRSDPFGNVIGVCSVGALEEAAERLGVADYDTARESVELIEDAVGPYGSIETWNDNPNTTKEEVLATFDKVIAATP